MNNLERCTKTSKTVHIWRGYAWMLWSDLKAHFADRKKKWFFVDGKGVQQNYLSWYERKGRNGGFLSHGGTPMTKSIFGTGINPWKTNPAFLGYPHGKHRCYIAQVDHVWFQSMGSNMTSHLHQFVNIWYICDLLPNVYRFLWQPMGLLKDVHVIAPTIWVKRTSSWTPMVLILDEFGAPALETSKCFIVVIWGWLMLLSVCQFMS